MKRMFGLEMMLAMTFSRPRFSVLQDPQMAAPFSQIPFSSRWEPQVITATGLLGSPGLKSPLTIGHPLAGDFFSAISLTSHEHRRHHNQDQGYEEPDGEPDNARFGYCRIVLVRPGNDLRFVADIFDHP